MRTLIRNLIRHWVAGDELAELARWRLAHQHVHGGLEEYPTARAALDHVKHIVKRESSYADLHDLRLRLRNMPHVLPIWPAKVGGPTPRRRRDETPVGGVPYQNLVGACGDER